MKLIRDELSMRSRFLELLAKNRVTSYWKVWRAIRATYRYPLEKLVAKIFRSVATAIDVIRLIGV